METESGGKMNYEPLVTEQLYNNICFRTDGCLEGLQVREFAQRLWAHWNAQHEHNSTINVNKEIKNV